jgi:maltokinase
VIEATALEKVLPDYLSRQRWYAGTDAPSTVRVRDIDEPVEGLTWALVDADTETYQVVVGHRPATEPPAFVQGHEAGVLGTIDGLLLYDAILDPGLALALLGVVVPGEKAEVVRPMGAEQSNSSLVYDNRLVLKLFRRLVPGGNPDVEVVTALVATGFENVPAPVGVWEKDDYDLAICQQFLVEAAEGWSLALTSLRDFYAADCEDPAESGGDFGPEAERLGDVTARMHIALAQAFGRHPGDPEAWAESLSRHLAKLDPDDIDQAEAARFVEQLRAVADPGPSIRVHGDYHLGQVLRTAAGWYVLDFEGEPTRPLEERTRPTSPLKDVAGMVRSFHYASRVAVSEQDEGQREAIFPKAERWERRNREAFLAGYLAGAKGTGLLPADEASRDTVLAAFELDKAVYEVLYERQYRPDWIDIPRSAVRRLLGT